MDGSGPQQPTLDETAGWPRISDYWPDRNGGGGATAYPQEESDPAPGRKRHRLGLMAGVIGSVVVVAVSGVVLLRMVTTSERPAPATPPTAAAGPEIVVPSPSPPVSIEPAPASPSASASASPAAPSSPPSSAPPPAKAPAGPAFPAATFVVAGGMRELNVSVGRPPNNGIARVTTPDDSSVTPDATLKDTTLTLTTRGNDNDGEARVDVVLDERIAWTIRTTHGVRRAGFAMADGKVTAFDLQGGANNFDMTLPRQDATIPLRMSGGVHTWRIRTEGSFPVKLHVREGIGEATLNGDRDENLEPGDTRKASGDDGGGLEIDAVGGVGTLEVEPL
ncbi:hypothetical protein Ade02nite_32530 [Paractinoplanes deccanensis]|uniref:Adhesin domain-containing protein n=1 Tax=Paractinoplanes deccanensis TaxID=113561 RepID=A0ABQ3Y3N9_9ACTN|nr:hypothetical protein [Actinoplanes deccanensis]GID74612.1 hypothetical protein Ade02nite_32530 [Actinoplanes deccanensis]